MLQKRRYPLLISEGTHLSFYTITKKLVACLAKKKLKNMGVVYNNWLLKKWLKGFQKRGDSWDRNRGEK